ncbi:hypothetical protein QEH42_gp086 [Microbacterium phage Pumpernickel]|uniref:Major capsid protein n=1 Tax=Microbacterium phage Pumpernickel TaxID=2885983 RepID=A0AAE8Y7M0_9CAUD|nr:hypothetical protein QEH42_gp086 [Microbacterium phage Pumpernickel]UDL15877.1 hypothetical protein SEA_PUMPERNICKEL_86 [Microbacterium phage Pumpernickel]
MVTFNGIVPPSPLEVAPCGLFSVARVVKHREDEEHWIGGFHVESDAFPTVTLRTNTDAEITAGQGVIYDGSDDSDTYQATPFFVELSAKATSVDFLRDGEDLSPTMEKQVKAVTQKAVERELWEGIATQNALPASKASFLRRASADGGAEVVTSGGVSPEKALALIEQSISNSPTGGRGVIHMTRDVASSLGSRLRYFEKNEIDENTYAVTRLGTLVVVGSGYTGAGPLGAAGTEASATNKWMYVTGGVQVDLGKPMVTAASEVSTNDHIARISFPVAVHFDPSIFYAAQVTLP